MIRQLIIDILLDIRERIQQEHDNRITRRRFGRFGEQGFLALTEIRDGIRDLYKYGACSRLGVKSSDGLVSVAELHQAVWSVINEYAPDMERVWD